MARSKGLREKEAHGPISNQCNAAPPTLNADISAQLEAAEKQSQEGASLVLRREEVVGTKRQRSRPCGCPLHPLQPTLPFSRFLWTSFFSSIKEVQKRKLNNPNYRIEKSRAHFHVNVTIVQQNKHSRNNEALVRSFNVGDGYAYK